MRLVVKVGTSTVDAGPAVLEDLAGQLAALAREGHSVALFSSGAVNAGRQAFGPGLEAPAAAALGQPLVFGRWRDACGRAGATAAQVLVDDRDLEVGGGAAVVVDALWRIGFLPVLNGNDAIDSGRSPVSDNDAMAALLALHLRADRLVLLTDQDGICTGDPRRDPSARPIRHISADALARLVPALADAAAGPQGRGGMASKAHAALRAARGGVSATVAHGREARVLIRAARGESVGTSIDAVPDCLQAATAASPRPSVREAVAYGVD